MATIITITGGLPRLGRTQLALNLALEQVRRGSQSGVFHEQHASSTIDQLVTLSAGVLHDRRTDDAQPVDVVRRGYQGVDILGCHIPLAEWLTVDRLRLQRCIGVLDIREGYDDLLIDTSGMSFHEVLACSLASSLVIVLLTPERASQAQAFALLRLLQLNGYHGLLRVLVNRVSCAVDASDIQRSFAALTRVNLGVDVPMLGFVPDDPQLALAQHAGQAFSSVFPDSEAAGQIVVLADAIEQLEQAEVRPLSVADYWGRVRDLLARPLQLPGGADLDRVVETSRSGG